MWVEMGVSLCVWRSMAYDASSTFLPLPAHPVVLTGRIGRPSEDTQARSSHLAFTFPSGFLDRDEARICFTPRLGGINDTREFMGGGVLSFQASLKTC
jgi:hypothetical protein